MNNNVTQSLMWDKLEHFQRFISNTANTLFQSIDSDLQPEVFLVGVLVNKKDDRHPIYFEPQDYGYIVDDLDRRLSELQIAFKNVDQFIKQLIKQEKLDPTLEEYENLRMKKKEFTKFITDILSLNDKSNYYTSEPSLVDDFYFLVVLKISKRVVSQYPMLVNSRKENYQHEFDRLFLCRDYIYFMESVIHTYLNECLKAFEKWKNQKSELMIPFSAIERSYDELIREAGAKFMETVAILGNKKIRGTYYFYWKCNQISSLKYEGEEGLGKMIIARQDHPNIKYTLQLQEPIKIQEFRKARKFLQLAGKDSLIISDAVFIYGLGKIIGQYNPRDESLFIINFISHLKWEVLHDNQVMMIVEYYQPRLPKTLINRDTFYSDLRRIFTKIEDTQLSDLWDIVMEATKQKHGTMLVITDKAEDESKRLGKQCFPIKPLRLDPSIIQQITSIDGSVLLDSHATCYAVGVILDGTATDKGDSSRGARYNSAIRYYEQHGKNSPTVLVIISEDGMIDLIP